MDMIKEFELVGLDKPTEEQQAIDFLYSLSPEFTTMQAELRNNENRVRAMPATLLNLVNFLHEFLNYDIIFFLNK